MTPSLFFLAAALAFGDADTEARAALAMARARLGLVPRAVLSTPPPRAAGPVWLTDYDRAVAERDRGGKPVVILFTDPSRCLPCRRLEAGALAEQTVRAALSGHVCLRVVLDGNPKADALARALRVDTIPTLLRFDKTGVLAAPPLTPDANGRVPARAVLDLLSGGPPEPPAPPPETTTRVEAAAAPRPRAFAGPVFNASHACPACRRAQFVVDHFNADGTHVHRCSTCGTSWFHATP